MTDSVLFQGPIEEANAAAQAQEDENRLAGNPPNAMEVDPAGQLPNPEGYTPVGEGAMTTPVEEAPGGRVPAVEVTTGVPIVDEVGGLEELGGGGGDVLLGAAVPAAEALLTAPTSSTTPLATPELGLPDFGAAAVTAATEPPPTEPPPTEPPPTEPPPTEPPPTEPPPTEPPPTEPPPTEPPPTEPPPTEPPPTEPPPTEPPPTEPPPTEPPPTEPPPTEPPPTEPPIAIDGRWKIDQTPAAGDKTGGDEIWENPERGQKADTLFDVSFNQGSYRLAEGQQIQVFLDVHHQHDDAVITTADPSDWTCEVTSKDPGLEVVNSQLLDGQLVVTLEAVRDGVNLTGDVFRVEVTAVPDDDAEPTPELLVFDINDDMPARDLTTQAVIGSDWDAHDDLVITIAENPVPDAMDQADLGAVVEAFEAEIEAHPPEALADADLGLELMLNQEPTLIDEQALEDLAEGGGDDSGLADAAFEQDDGVDDVLLMDLPLDAVFHGAEGADDGRG